MRGFPQFSRIILVILSSSFQYSVIFTTSMFLSTLKHQNLWLCGVGVCLERKCYKFLQSHFNVFLLTKNHARNVNCKYETHPVHLCICQILTTQVVEEWTEQRKQLFHLVVLRSSGQLVLVSSWRGMGAM